jgi:hypothetical protein
VGFLLPTLAPGAAARAARSTASRGQSWKTSFEFPRHPGAVRYLSNGVGAVDCDCHRTGMDVDLNREQFLPSTFGLHRYASELSMWI